LPSLQQLTVRFLLSHASEYEEESRGMIASVLLSLPSLSLADEIAAPASFAGCSALPSLLHSLRAFLTTRPKLARSIFSQLLEAPLTGPRMSEGVEASCNQLLLVGCFKREIVGPIFARPELRSYLNLRLVATLGDRWCGTRVLVMKNGPMHPSNIGNFSIA
ncbi:MAG: hypothetical protein SGPRY_009015, partial [Prymnesium sp.]